MVWVDVDGNEVLFNTAEGRLPKNLRRDPHIMIAVQDRNDPQSYMVFHGTASMTEAGADDTSTSSPNVLAPQVPSASPGRNAWSCGSRSTGSVAMAQDATLT
jgi:hypothetical protein